VDASVIEFGPRLAVALVVLAVVAADRDREPLTVQRNDAIQRRGDTKKPR